ARRHGAGAAAQGPPPVDASARHRDATHGGRLAAPRAARDRHVLREPPPHAGGPAATRADRQGKGVLRGQRAERRFALSPLAGTSDVGSARLDVSALATPHRITALASFESAAVGSVTRALHPAWPWHRHDRALAELPFGLRGRCRACPKAPAGPRAFADTPRRRSALPPSSSPGTRAWSTVPARPCSRGRRRRARSDS